MAEPIIKQLTCPGCGQAAAVRVVPSSDVPQRWQCPHCKKIHASDRAAVDSAPQAA